MENKLNINFGIATLLVVIFATMLFLPHIDNFSPFIAIGIFGASMYSNKKIALFVPIFIKLICDYFMATKYNSNFFHSTFLYVYGSYFLILLVGFYLRKKEKNMQNIGSVTLVGSLLFFIITNFGVWITGNMYAKNFKGLVECYIAAIPFLRNSILGDLFYVSLIFISYNYLNLFITNKLQTAKA